MTGTLTNVVKQFQASWTTDLEAKAVLQAFREAGAKGTGPLIGRRPGRTGRRLGPESTLRPPV